MRLATGVQIFLSVLFAVDIVINYKTAMWVHSMAYADPVRQEWQAKFDQPMAIVWFAILIPWLTHTFYYFGAFDDNDEMTSPKEIS